MNFFGAIFRALASANSHTTANLGLGGVVGALAIHVAAAATNPTGSGHGVAQIALSTLDQYAATPLLATGALAAYFGRPATIPPDAPTPPAT